jgi:hypothetical protein
MSASANKKSKKVNGNTKAQNTSTGAVARDLEFEAEVLFQRLYDKWYAFTVVDDDCLMTQVTEDDVKQRMSNKKTPRAS